MKKTTKLKYLTPTIEVISVEMEQGIAAGSSTINTNDGVTSEWDALGDEEQGVNW